MQAQAKALVCADSHPMKHLLQAEIDGLYMLLLQRRCIHWGHRPTASVAVSVRQCLSQFLHQQDAQYVKWSGRRMKYQVLSLALVLLDRLSFEAYQPPVGFPDHFRVAAMLQQDSIGIAV